MIANAVNISASASQALGPYAVETKRHMSVHISTSSIVGTHTGKLTIQCCNSGFASDAVPLKDRDDNVVEVTLSTGSNEVLIDRIDTSAKYIVIDFDHTGITSGTFDVRVHGKG